MSIFWLFVVVYMVFEWVKGIWLLLIMVIWCSWVMEEFFVGIVYVELRFDLLIEWLVVYRLILVGCVVLVVLLLFWLVWLIVVNRWLCRVVYIVICVFLVLLVGGIYF